jgi:hypothetical protein
MAVGQGCAVAERPWYFSPGGAIQLACAGYSEAVPGWRSSGRETPSAATPSSIWICSIVAAAPGVGGFLAEPQSRLSIQKLFPLVSSTRGIQRGPESLFSVCRVTAHVLPGGHRDAAARFAAAVAEAQR